MRPTNFVIVLTGWCVSFSAIVSSAADNLRSGEPTSALLSRYGLEMAWSAQAVLNPARDHLAQFNLDEELVYTQGTNGILTAFNAESGQREWAIRLGRFDEPTFPIVSNENLVLAVVGQSMYGVDKLKGNLKWSLRLPGPPSTGPSMDEDQIYVGTLDGSVYAYSIRQIEKLYLERRLPEWSHNALVWRFQAAKEITSPPIPVGRTVNFASRSGSLYAVSANRRELTYQFETDAPIVAPMARLGDIQFLASEDFTFYAINAINGNVIWEFVTGFPIRKAPYAVGQSLYLSPDRGGVYCLEVADGVRRWWKPFLTEFVAASNRFTYARDEDGNLAIIETDTGSLVGRVTAYGYPRHIANDRTDRIYLATLSGRVLALREKGRDIPNFHKYPERRPILPDFAPEEGETEEPAPPTEP